MKQKCRSFIPKQNKDIPSGIFTRIYTCDYETRMAIVDFENETETNGEIKIQKRRCPVDRCYRP